MMRQIPHNHLFVYRPITVRWENAIVDDHTKRQLQSIASPLMDACESFLRTYSQEGDYESVEELEKLLRDELSYRAAIVESDCVRPPGGWGRLGRG